MPTIRRDEVVRIAARLKAARHHARPTLSQRAAAEAIRVSVRTLQDWEQGKHPPPAPRIADLAQLYKVSADFLVGLGPDSLDGEAGDADAEDRSLASGMRNGSLGPKPQPHRALA